MENYQVVVALSLSLWIYLESQNLIFQTDAVGSEELDSFASCEWCREHLLLAMIQL